jgi:hypothetical protein
MNSDRYGMVMAYFKVPPQHLPGGRGGSEEIRKSLAGAANTWVEN